MPPEVCQYGPAAYHSRVVTFLLHIFGGFQYSQTKIAQTEKGDNKYFSLKVVDSIYVFFGFYTCQMTSHVMTSFKDLFTNTNKLMRK